MSAGLEAEAAELCRPAQPTPAEQERVRRILRHEEVARLAEKMVIAEAGSARPYARSVWSIVAEAETLVDVLESKRQDACRILPEPTVEAAE